MAKLNRPNGKLFGSSATNIGVFGSGQTGETPATSTNPDAINTLGTHWEDGWNGAVVSQAPYTAPFVEDMNAVNYVNSYNGAYLLQQGIPEYSRTVDYYVDSVCTYNGSIYICIQDNPAVNASTDPGDPPGTLINFDPTDTDHWDERVELPTMNDNEVLVGSVGGVGVATDTLNQGDIVASSGGLDIKSNVIVNADIKSDAAIAESKLALDHSTDSLNTAITNHTGNTSNPHSVTKAQVLSGDLIVNADVDDSAGIKESKLDLDYATDTLNTNIGNVAGDLSTHTSNKNNPHETKISNLKDVTIANLQDGDVILYDLASDKYVNQQPPGGALSTLADTTITTPIADKSLVQYDLDTGKWTNSSEVWNRIEVTSVPYYGLTPNDHPLSSGDVFMQATDNKHQILTTTGSTGGYRIVLPSTGVKKGDRFSFEFPYIVAETSDTKYACIRTSDLSLFHYVYNKYFRYNYTALVDTPTTSSDWWFTYDRIGVPLVYGSFEQSGLSVTAGTRLTKDSPTVFTMTPGVWQMSLDWAFFNGNSPSSSSNPWFVALCYNNHGTAIGYNSNRLGGSFGANVPMSGSGSYTMGAQTVYFTQLPAFNTSKLINQTRIDTAWLKMSVYSSSNATGVYLLARVSGILVSPRVASLTT